jgi:hypothetical protein
MSSALAQGRAQRRMVVLGQGALPVLTLHSIATPDERYRYRPSPEALRGIRKYVPVRGTRSRSRAPRPTAHDLFARRPPCACACAR